MSPTLTAAPPAPARRRRGVLSALAACVGFVVVLAMLLWATRTPGHVPSITIENPHQWSSAVEAAGESRPGWLGIGAVDATATKTFGEVLDQGPIWVFRFSYAGVDGGELAVSRADLQRGGWKVTIPSEFAERMRAAGLPASAG